jgi:hypothetical protein
MYSNGKKKNYEVFIKVKLEKYKLYVIVVLQSLGYMLPPLPALHLITSYTGSEEWRSPWIRVATRGRSGG